MTVLTDRLPWPNTSKVFLVEQTAGEQLNLWTLATSQTYTYWCATSNRVTGVKQDGVALTSRASIALTESNAGSYYWDQAAGRVYAHPTGSVSPYTATLQAIVLFTFSNRSRIYNGIYYDPRIKSIPSLSMRVERVFGDPGQLGSGEMVYANNDGFFDSLSGLQWNAGRIVLKMGIDDLYPPYAEAAYSEFDTVGTWIAKEWSKTDSDFTVHFEEIKSALKVKIPIDHFTRDEFPFMREEDVGKPKPIAYGQIYDVAPICTNLGEKRFRVAGHAIQGFFGVRMRDETTGYWVDTSFTTTDKSIAEFTVSGWDMKAEISVDFFGKTTTGGDLMDNPSDVVTDILRPYLGYAASDLDTTSFSDSYSALVGQSRLSLYLSKEVDAYDVFSDINAAVGSYLFGDHLGVFRYVVYVPPVGSSVEQFTEDDIFQFTEVVNATEIISRVKVKYQHRTMQDYWQVRFSDRASSQYLQGAATPILKELELPFVSSSDGLSVGQRMALHEGVPQRVYKARVSAKGWTLLPSGFIQATYSRGGVSGVYEILEIKKNLETGLVDLVVGGLRGVSSEGVGSPGHWCDSAGASYTDDFNRADENPISSPWSSAGDGGCKILDNVATGSASGQNCISIYGAGLSNDQYAEADVSVYNDSLGVYVGVVLRYGGGGSNRGYLLVWEPLSGTVAFIKRSSVGSLSAMQSGGTFSEPIGVGLGPWRLRGKVIGTTFYAYANGVLLGTATDDTYSNGFAGVINTTQSSLWPVDNFECGDIDPGPVFPASLGSGSAGIWDPAWTDEQKAYARQNFGYWSDENGFADPTDPESYLASTWA